jgi:hypothetical protein
VPEHSERNVYNHGKITFKGYSIGQMSLPMSLDDLIDINHLVHVVNSAIERMNLKPLLDRYKGGVQAAIIQL